MLDLYYVSPMITLRYCSFKAEIKVSDLSKVLDGECWPSGVHVR